MLQLRHPPFYPVALPFLRQPLPPLPAFFQLHQPICNTLRYKSRSLPSTAKRPPCPTTAANHPQAKRTLSSSRPHAHSASADRSRWRGIASKIFCCSGVNTARTSARVSCITPRSSRRCFRFRSPFFSRISAILSSAFSQIASIFAFWSALGFNAPSNFSIRRSRACSSFVPRSAPLPVVVSPAAKPADPNTTAAIATAQSRFVVFMIVRPETSPPRSSYTVASRACRPSRSAAPSRA